MLETEVFAARKLKFSLKYQSTVIQKVQKLWRNSLIAALFFYFQVNQSLAILNQTSEELKSIIWQMGKMIKSSFQRDKFRMSLEKSITLQKVTIFHKLSEIVKRNYKFTIEEFYYYISKLSCRSFEKKKLLP